MIVTAHELRCDGCNKPCRAAFGRLTVEVLTVEARKAGWKVDQNGRASCPECQKKGGGK